MLILLRYLFIGFIVLIAGNKAFAQQNIAYLDIPEPNFTRNQLPSYREFRQAEQARLQSVNQVNNLLLPIVGRTLFTTCFEEPVVLYFDIRSSSNRPIAYLPTATSGWELISRQGPAWIELTPDTTFYVAEMNASLDSIGPRLAITYRYTPPPSDLNTPDQINLCEGEDFLLRFNNPEGLVVSFTGAFVGATTADSMVIPSTTSGLVTADKTHDCVVQETIRFNPAIPVPTITPNRYEFCYEPENVFIFGLNAIQFNLFRNLNDPVPALRLAPGEQIPASFFITSDSVFYVQAQVSPGCNARKQRVTYKILVDSSNAGNNVASCIGVPVSLSATRPRSGQTGRWLPNSNVTFSDRNNPNATVSGNNVGLFELVWEVINPNCPPKTDKVNFTVSGFKPIQVESAIVACEETFEIPYFADPGVEVALYPNANGTNPIRVINSGEILVVNQTQALATYYLGYVSASCRPELKEISVSRNISPILNFEPSYQVCQLNTTSLVVRNPIVTTGRQPFRIGSFSANGAPINIEWNNTGAFLTISGLALDNIYTINYEYTFGNCSPVIGSFTINTNGNPGAAPPNLNKVACSTNLVLNLPTTTPVTEIFLDGITDGSVTSNTTGIFPIVLNTPETVFRYGYSNIECGRGQAGEIRVRLTRPFQGFSKLPDLVTTLGSSVELSSVPANPALQYFWTNQETGNTITNFNAPVRPDRTTIYTLRVVSPDDCEYFDTIQVTVNSNFNMPNMFTPNGNGLNETFGISPKFNINTPYELTIANKYGQVVFNKTGPNVGWNGLLSNGDPAPQDTYFYKIRFTEGLDDKVGSVQLVR